MANLCISEMFYACLSIFTYVCVLSSFYFTAFRQRHTISIGNPPDIYGSIFLSLSLYVP